MTTKFTINATFKITGRGIVLSGFIDEGAISIGDYIEFNALDKKRKRKILAIDGAKRVDFEKKNTGLLIQCEDEKEINELGTWKPNNERAIVSRAY